MIQLTRLNRHPLWLNAELLKYIENTPDTVITLVNGEKIVVLDAVEVVIDRLIEYRRKLLDGMLFCGLTSPQGLSHLRSKESPENDDDGPIGPSDEELKRG